MCLVTRGKKENSVWVNCRVAKKSRKSYEQKPSFEAFYMVSFEGQAPFVNNYSNRAFEGAPLS